ncbi:MAG: hypothetical protein AAGF95_08345 [Chloroflexota bacterium]
MLEQAITHYHRMLDPPTAKVTWERLNELQKQYNLYFGDRPLATVLRPRFICSDQKNLLEATCEIIANAARRVAVAALEDQTLRAELGVTPTEETLINMHPGYTETSVHSRMDSFLTLDGSSLQFVEYNAESPAAIAYQDILSTIFLELPIMQQFAADYSIQTLPAREHLMEAILNTWKAFQSVKTPNIAILDWDNVPTYSEFLLFQQYFRENGLNVIICTPDDLNYHSGQLFTHNHTSQEFPVDIVYKRVLTSEIITHYGAATFEHPLIRAYADGKICLINSFRAKLLHKKALFAVLTDDSYQSMFTTEEQTAITKHIPWTRVCRTGKTTYKGQSIDLLDFARTYRERLLLKPNDEYGGKGIVVGWETEPHSWENALMDALKSPFVIQERVVVAQEDYPTFLDGEAHISQRLVDSDPFLFGTDVAGCLTRLSTETLLNVTAGGGSTVPTFLLEPIAQR